MGEERRIRIAYIFTDLPDRGGTFPVAEVEEMSIRGADIQLVCLRSRLAAGDTATSLRRRFPVRAVPYLSPAALAAATAAFVLHPIRMIRLVSRLVRDTASSPSVLVKTLAILPKCALFARELRRDGVDLIHAYWASLPGRAAWVVSALAGIPYTSWAHAGADIYNRRHQTEASLTTVLQGASAVFTCNKANLRYFETLRRPPASARVRYQPHGIDVGRFCPATAQRSLAIPSAARDEVRLLSIGRFGEAKGFHHAIRACALLAAEGVPVRYRIIGDGARRPVLEQLVRELGLEARVELPGELPQEALPQEYHSADLYLAPSIIGAAGARDGLPNVVLEAMACGLPVVGSDAVGIPEAVIPGVTGLLVPPADSEALAAAVRALSADADARRQMGEEGRKLVLSTYERQLCMDALWGAFRDLVPVRKTPGGRAA